MTIKTKAVAVRRGNAILSGAEAIDIKDDLDYEDAAGYVKNIKAVRQEIMAFTKDTVTKAHEAHKAATTMRNNLLDPLKEADGVIRKKMLAFQVERDKAAEKLAEKVAEETGSEVMAEAAAHSAAVPKVSGIGNVSTWDFEVTDESKIKAEFMVPDLVRIRKVVRTMHYDAERVVGGIKVKEKKGLRV